MSDSWASNQKKNDDVDKSSSYSLVDSAAEPGVEDEKCVVEQYRTTKKQRSIFENHISTCSKDSVPIEWVIDIADQTNGWFYGTAYHFNDTTNMLHVMVPDKQNPSFDGSVLLDHRTVHLIECVDGTTDALFNKIIRDSVVKVRWDVDWFEEDATPKSSPMNKSIDPTQRWVESAARYYLRIANQLLVEDDDFGQNGSRGFVMITADMNVRLKYCLKGKGQEDFDRLVTDGSVLSSPEVLEAAKISMAEMAFDPEDENIKQLSNFYTHKNEEPISIKTIADMSRKIQEHLSDLLDEREKNVADKSKLAMAFKSFTMDGDLDAGLKLYADSEEINLKDEIRNKYLTGLKNGNKDPVKDEFEVTADQLWILAEKLEKKCYYIATIWR
mmetsp:Transcript_14176/g.13702  ORF Transcript_14176/g.13702 Transcript_14176/m.13702 type:complete len:385 (-) Transcript_14176:188-1342(-)